MTCIVHSMHDLRLAHPGRQGQRDVRQNPYFRKSEKW
jgi:hypothetical protein